LGPALDRAAQRAVARELPGLRPLLNKVNVVANHLIIATRRFVPRSLLLARKEC
jgi:ATP adenylyltransferase/5',5'''-P-1,P-4-tetraphosphate phosphorylase II